MLLQNLVDTNMYVYKSTYFSLHKIFIQTAKALYISIFHIVLHSFTQMNVKYL